MGVPEDGGISRFYNSAPNFRTPCFQTNPYGNIICRHNDWDFLTEIRYKASPNSTGAQMAAADPKTAALGKAVSAPGRGNQAPAAETEEAWRMLE